MSRSLEIYREACEVFPGCVNSPVRAAVKPYPFVVERSEGPYIHTVDGEVLIDYVLGYGPLILGHRHPHIRKAIENQLERGWLYAAPTEVEVRLAKKILGHVMPSGLVRFVNSGTEATHLAVRLARGYTKRRYIVKFDGCYHGAHDYVLISAGSAAQHYGVPYSEGIPEEVIKTVLIAEYNNVDVVEKLFREMGSEIAAVILEPVIGNFGVIPAKMEFLKAVRELCSRYGALLVFDETITGFRLGLGGAQQLYGVSADVVVLGKIIGGGLPIGAVVARRDVGINISPSGRVFNAGTFNAHPLSMAAGLATIEVLESEPVYTVCRRAAEEVSKAFLEASRGGVQINRVESMLQVFFIDRPVDSVAVARMSNTRLYEEMHVELRRRGVFVTPSQFEAIFTSYAHTREVVERTTEAIHDVFRRIRGWS